jgi:hypothetical protein
MSILNSFRAYRRQADKVRLQAPAALSELTLARDFFAWQRTVRHPQSTLSTRRPWLTFAATRFLESQLHREHRVFEWGGGGSTLFFASRVREVVTVENDGDWVKLLGEALAAEGLSDSEIHHVGPDATAPDAEGDPADPALYLTTAATLRPAAFRAYATFIDRFADASFDIILVDGRARPSCLRHAVPKLAPGGWLVLDNAEREHYQPAQADLAHKGWHKREFYGPGPGVWSFWQTIFWQKPTGHSAGEHS